MNNIHHHIAHHRKSDGAVQILADHLLSVASYARKHAGKIGLDDFGELMGLLHDFGKYSQEFQIYLNSAAGLVNPDEDDNFVDTKKKITRKVDHSSAGAQLLWQALSKQGQSGLIAGQILALCIASHHSGLIDCLTSDANSCTENTFEKRMHKSDMLTHLCASRCRADDKILSRVQELLYSSDMINPMDTFIAQLVRENRDADEKVLRQKMGILVRYLFSCLVDADRIDSANFEHPRQAQQRLQGHYTDWKTLAHRLEKHLESFTPERPIDHLRTEISRHCLKGAIRNKGIYKLTVPTGGGKTLASLRFALNHAYHYGMERVVYVIPFTTIIDQNAEVVRAILEPDGVESGSVLLELHSNLTPEKQSWRGKVLAENWDAPLIYTTTVQFLEALFGAGTRGVRRMHQLSNAVLVFDEIQTLPINCTHLFNNAINFLVEQCGSTVVLCTATQPLLDKVDPRKGALRISEEGELVPDVKHIFNALKRVEIINKRKPGGWSMEEIRDLAIKETKNVGSCLVIVNTKDAAKKIYRLSQNHDVPVFHLSTNMCPAHRKTILTEIIRRLKQKEPTLCVSTPLIEAGVDVDFGAVIRFTAGLDSIAQAAGRCNRHGRPNAGHVHVVNAKDERLDKLKEVKIGQEKGERVLDDFKDAPEKFGHNPIGPEALAWYYENYFFARAGDMDYPVSTKEVGRNDTLFNLLSINSKAMDEYLRTHHHHPNIYFRQSFMAAAKAFKVIDGPTQGVIVPFGSEGSSIIAELCSDYRPEQAYTLLRRAQQFSVNIFPWLLEKMTRNQAIKEVQKGTGILYLADPRYYHMELGLSDTPEGEMEFLHVGTK